jgi:hypothetical protein
MIASQCTGLRDTGRSVARPAAALGARRSIAVGARSTMATRAQAGKDNFRTR